MNLDVGYFILHFKNTDGGFWARRSAEQGNSSDSLSEIKKKLGAIAMSIKNVLKNAGIYMNTALVAIGWLLFLIGMLIPEPIIKTILMAIARVLPKALYQTNIARSNSRA